MLHHLIYGKYLVRQLKFYFSRFLKLNVYYDFAKKELLNTLHKCIWPANHYAT